MTHGTKKQREIALSIYKNGCAHNCQSCPLPHYCENGKFTPKEAAERFCGGLKYINPAP